MVISTAHGPERGPTRGTPHTRTPGSARTLLAHVPSSISRRSLGTILAVAGLFYSSWFLEYVLPTGIDHTHAFLSALAADDQPYRWIFGTCDAVSGSLIAVAGVVALCRYRRTFGNIVVFGALALFGLSTVVDAQIAMPCRTAGCSVPKTGLLPQLRDTHAWSSMTAVTTFFVAMAAVTVLSLARGRWRAQRWSMFTVALVLVAATIWLGIADGLQSAHNWDLRLGIVQRLQVLAMTAWLVLFGRAVVLEKRGAPERL